MSPLLSLGAPGCAPMSLHSLWGACLAASLVAQTFRNNSLIGSGLLGLNPTKSELQAVEGHHGVISPSVVAKRKSD